MDKANEIKTGGISIIIGNPPYSISSQNKGNYIEKLMKSYLPKRLDPKAAENLEPLSDDYIKFIRFAHRTIAENNKEGIISFITNNNFLRGRIHRQMRLSLLQSFDKIYIYDLHGDAREEVPPKGKSNESVFGIQTGV